MDNSTLFETVGIWPVKLCLEGKKGYALWSMGEPELLLTIQGSLVLFRSTHALNTFVVEGHACNLSERPSYKELQQILTNRKIEPIRSAMSVDFAQIATSLTNEHWESWSSKTVVYILNGLNMLWDICVTMKKNEFKKLMRGGNSPLGGLMNMLTTLEVTERHYLRSYNRESAIKAYKFVVDFVQKSSICLC